MPRSPVRCTNWSKDFEACAMKLAHSLVTPVASTFISESTASHVSVIEDALRAREEERVLNSCIAGNAVYGLTEESEKAMEFHVARVEKCEKEARDALIKWRSVSLDASLELRSVANRRLGDIRIYQKCGVKFGHMAQTTVQRNRDKPHISLWEKQAATALAIHTAPKVSPVKVLKTFYTEGDYVFSKYGAPVEKCEVFLTPMPSLTSNTVPSSSLESDAAELLDGPSELQ